MDEAVRAHVIVFGKVQGVFFRAETQKAALGFGVTGWVRNKADGTVEAIFEGHSNAVNLAIDWCRQGSPSARVTDVQVDWDQCSGEYDTFSVTY